MDRAAEDFAVERQGLTSGTGEKDVGHWAGHGPDVIRRCRQRRRHRRRDAMVFAADRWSTRDAPSLWNHDRCRLEYAQIWPSASARAVARSAPPSSATAFPVDAATWTNSRYPCVCDATLGRRPDRR